MPVGHMFCGIFAGLGEKKFGTVQIAAYSLFSYKALLFQNGNHTGYIGFVFAAKLCQLGCGHTVGILV